ncbi:MAG: hypothetical protein JWP89_5507 [Schlesneria sp.]|nr:hypothetical protein [Schlesneria sp.]
MYIATTYLKSKRASRTWICGLAVLQCLAAVSFLHAQDGELGLFDRVQIHNAKAAAVDAQQGPAEFLPRRSPKEEKILAALSRTTEVAFRDNDLTSALEHLKEMHEIEIWIDASRLDIDNLNVTLEISDVPLRSCLNLMLEPLDLAYFVEDDVLKVTSQEIAATKLITRTYPAGDLFSSSEEVIELTRVLETGLGLLQKSGVPNQLIVSRKSQSLILRHSHQMHDQLLQLLRTLRESNTNERITKLIPIPNELVISIGFERDAQGAKRNKVPTVFFNRQYCQIEEVSLVDEHRQIELQVGKKAAQDTIVHIRADQDVPLAPLNQLIEKCKAAGFKNIVLKAD